jgi:hypothetical protein
VPRLPSAANAAAFATFPWASSGSSSPVLSARLPPLAFAWNSTPSRSSRTASPNPCCHTARPTVPPATRNAPTFFFSTSLASIRRRNSSGGSPTSAAA